MRRVRVWSRLALILALAVASAGCHGSQRRGGFGRNEPALIDPVAPGDAVVVAPQAAVGETFVDRHPLFATPREVYEGTPSENKLLRTTRAAVIGVPKGFVREIRQIVVGVPQPPAAPAF